MNQPDDAVFDQGTNPTSNEVPAPQDSTDATPAAVPAESGASSAA